MNNRGADMPLDIVGYAAKTEELKAELLSAVAAVFKNTAMGSRAMPREDGFAHMLNLMLMLANRCGMDLDTVGSEMFRQAKSGLIGDDAFAGDYRAVIGFAEKRHAL